VEHLPYLVGPTISLIALVYTVISARSKAARSEIDGLTTRIDETSRRVEKLETELVHMPTKEQVHRLEVQLAEIQGTSRTQAEVQKQVQATVSRVEGFLLNERRNS
jgi:hypothetical protein